MTSVPFTTIDLSHRLQTALYVETQTLNSQMTNPTQIVPDVKNDIAISNTSFIIPNEYLAPSKQHKKVFQKLLRTAMRKRAREIAKYNKQRPLFGPTDTTTPPASTITNPHKCLAILRQINASQPIQRSEEWFAMRRTRITASEYFKVMGTSTARDTFVFEKATEILQPDKTKKRRTPPSFHDARGWGTIFEDVCVMVYTSFLRKGAVVEEFGMLPHSEHTFLGASPDGISNEKSASEQDVGRMLECKAPYSRELKHGHIKDAYLAQMQGQLEVAQLNECDYLECQFECLTKEEVGAYMNRLSIDTTTTTAHRTQKKNAIGGRALPDAVGYIAFVPGSPQTSFQYGCINCIDDASVSASIQALSYHDTTNEPNTVEVVYWRLKNYQLLTIYRNAPWFDSELLPRLTDTWKRVQELVDHPDHYHTIAEQRKMKKKQKNTKQKNTYVFRD